MNMGSNKARIFQTSNLSIDSIVGQGTRIILLLPSATGAEVVTVDPALDRGPAFNRITAPRVVLEKPCVLLVDDDATVRDVLMLSLEDAGYVVLPADSGAAALVRLTSGPHVDIIVSDLTMPSMDGLTLIRAAQEQQSGLPAILLTGYAGDGAALAVGGVISGKFSLLRKPVSGTQLIDRITALLEYDRIGQNVPNVDYYAKT
jgi:CheY-like chemotaxis protein